MGLVSVKLVLYADTNPLPQCLVGFNNLWINRATAWWVIPKSALGKDGAGIPRSDVTHGYLFFDNLDRTGAFFFKGVNNPLKIGDWGYGKNFMVSKGPENFEWKVISEDGPPPPNWESIDIGVDFSGLSDSGGDDSDANSSDQG